MQLEKIVVKTDKEKHFGWMHFCNVPADVKQDFDNLINKQDASNNYWIEKWMKQDYDMDAPITLAKVTELKNRIKGTYKEKYPHMYLDTATDKQGWSRVWYTEHMQEEINKSW